MVCRSTLKDKYVNAADLLEAVMLQAQVSSTGEVLATDPVLQPDGSYQVVVVGPPNHAQPAEPDAEGVDHLVAGHPEQGRRCLAGQRYRPQDRNQGARRATAPGGNGSRGSPRSRCAIRTRSRPRWRTCTAPALFPLRPNPLRRNGRQPVKRLSLLVAIVTMATVGTVCPSAVADTTLPPCPQRPR